MTSSQMGVRRTFEKFQDRGSWYRMILYGYYLSLEYKMFQCIEYGRQREYDASQGVTAEDPKVRNGTIGWTDY